MFDYLASPYTDPDPLVREDRYQKAMHATAIFLSCNIAVYSPIVHCHELVKAHDLPKDAKFWKWYNESMIERSRRLLILLIPGWLESKGVLSERDFATRLFIPTRGVEILEGNTVEFQDL